jgi:glycosyltransferase involved in cell wall biosynthesis
MLVLYGHDGSMLVGAAALGRIFRRTVIVDVTEWFDQSSRRTMGAWLLDFIARRIVPQLATHASVISEEAARYLPRALPRTVVTSMVSHEWTEAIARAENRERDHGHFMCVFSGSERRGVENLIHALETLALRHAETNFELRLTGNPNASREVDLSTVKRLRVRRTGMLKRSEYAALLKEADCLIIPGDSGTDKDNAFPNRLPEYLLSGKPTVLAGYPAAARRLRHAVEALLLPSSDPTLLVEAIEHLLLDVESATTMGNAGLKAAQRLFDPKTVLKPLVDDLFRIDR